MCTFIYIYICYMCVKYFKIPRNTHKCLFGDPKIEWIHKKTTTWIGRCSSNVHPAPGSTSEARCSPARDQP